MTETQEMKLECHECGVSSTWRDGFVDRTNVRLGPHHLCIACSQYRHKYRDYYMAWFLWTLGGLTTGYLLTGRAINSIAFVVSAYVLTYLAVVLHELAHFLAAIAVGAKVPVLSFGGGSRAKIFKLRNSFVILSPAPTEGLISITFSSKEHFRKKMALIVAAGPIANLIAALAGAYYALESGSPLSDIPLAALMLWIAINAFLFLGNLFLDTNDTAVGSQPSDGSQLMALPGLSDEDIDRAIRARSIVLAYVEYLYGRPDKALDLIEDEIEHGENSFLTQDFVTVLYAEAGRLEEGIEIGREYLRNEDLEPQMRAFLQNNLAFILFLTSDPELLDEAHDLSTAAFEALPMMLAVRSTHGSILIAKGRYQEGVDLLTDKRFRLETPKNRATVGAVRAVGLAKLGELESARRAIQVARELDPDNRHLPAAEASI